MPSQETMPIPELSIDEKRERITHLLEENDSAHFIRALEQASQENLFPHLLPRLLEVINGSEAAVHALQEELVAQEDDPHSAFDIFTELKYKVLEQYNLARPELTQERLQFYSKELLETEDKNVLIEKLNELANKGVMSELYIELADALLGNKSAVEKLQKRAHGQFTNEESYHNQLMKRILEMVE